MFINRILIYCINVFVNLFLNFLIIGVRIMVLVWVWGKFKVIWFVIFRIIVCFEICYYDYFVCNCIIKVFMINKMKIYYKVLLKESLW